MAKKKGKTKKASPKRMSEIEDVTAKVCMGPVRGMGGMDPFFSADTYPEGLAEAMRQLVDDFPYLEGKCVVYSQE